jgi:hypothetical protein
MIYKTKISSIVNCLFGIAFGFLLFRLILGPKFQYPALYMRAVWLVLYPVHYLRNYTDQTIYILFYVLVWSYILITMVVVYEAPLRKTILKMLFWMGVLALPFIPFGIQYMSLANYMTGISSYVLRLLPFIGLLVWLFLVNRFFFRQNYLVAGAWAFVNFLFVIVVVTLTDLLPMLKSRILLHALGYRISLANTFVSRMPVPALLISIVLAVFFVFVFERQFLRVPRTENPRLSLLTPVSACIALFLVLMILRDDFRRYRYFNYQGGIATVYFAAYDDRQILSFDQHEFTLNRCRQNVFYPFGRFNVRDTVRRHAEDILGMKLIEGLDYYRLSRIVKILAHGPRDSVVYRRLQPVIEGRRYQVPEQFEYWAEYLARRYGSPDNDITVTGWVRINGMPLARTEFIVNRVSFGQRKIVEPVWQDYTNASGRFEFSCYKDIELDNGYFQVNFSLPDTTIGNDLQNLKIVNLLPVFSSPGNYALDTLDIALTRRGSASYGKSISIQTSSKLDSFLLSMPEIRANAPIIMTASVAKSGMIENIMLTHFPSEIDTSARLSWLEQIKASRFYVRGSDSNVRINIY